MTAKPPIQKPAAGKPAVKSPDRAEDLAAALRENLRRRKAQAQARAAGAAAKSERDEPPET